MARPVKDANPVVTVLLVCLGTVVATALFHYYLLTYLLLFGIVALGFGIPSMMSGSESDKRLALISLLSTLFGGAVGVAWLLVSR